MLAAIGRGLVAMLCLVSLVVLTPAANANHVPNRWFSGTLENATTNYTGFRHRHQHRSFGALGGTTQSFEMSCGTNPIGEPRIIVNNVLALLDPAFAPDSWVELAAIYSCGTDGVFRRSTVARVTRDNFIFSNKEEPILDTGIEHEYAILHNHDGPSCGSQTGLVAWVHYVDGVKFSCAGFQDFIPPGASAPHSYEGEYFLEINDNTAGVLKARHHYLSAMRFNQGSGWFTGSVGWDTYIVEAPAGGHGDTTLPRDWWHPCAGMGTATCH